MSNLRRSSRFKVLVRLGVVIFLLILLVVLLPFLVDLNKYQEQYRPLIEDALNRPVTLKSIRLTIFPNIGARVVGFAVQDDPSFSSDAFASLTSLDVGVKWIPLLRGHVEVEEIALRDPDIAIIKNRKGAFNVSTMGKQGGPKPDVPAEVPTPLPDGLRKIPTLLSVDRVVLTSGKLSYRDLSTAKPTQYALHDLNLQLNHLHLGQTASLHLITLVQPLNLPLTIDGTIGPLKETMDLDSLDLHVVGGSTPSMSASHAITTADLPVTLPLKKPVKLKDVQVAAELKGHEARLQNLSFELLNGQVKAQGVTTWGSDTPSFNGKVSIQDVHLGPAMEAAGLEKITMSGTAAAEFAVQGRGFSKRDLTHALEGTGQLVIRDGKIEGINLMQEVLALLKVSELVKEMVKVTVFSILETNVEIKQGLIKVRRLLIESHDFQLTATGTVGFDQTLNLQASLNLPKALSQQIGGASRAVKVTLTEGRMVVPLIITGTAQAPSVGLDIKALGAKAQEQLKEKAGEAAGGLLTNVLKKGQDALKKLFGQ